MVNRLGTATATELWLTAVMVIVPRKLGAGAGPPGGGGGTMTLTHGVSALLHMDIVGQRPLMSLWFCQKWDVLASSRNLRKPENIAVHLFEIAPWQDLSTVARSKQ